MRSKDRSCKLSHEQPLLLAEVWHDQDRRRRREGLALQASEIKYMYLSAPSLEGARGKFGESQGQP